MYEDCESFTKDRSGANNKALDGSGIIDEESVIIIETSLRTDEERFNNYNFSVVRVKKYKTNQHVFLQYRDNNKI